MTFDDLLNRLWMADFEVTKFDWILVLKNYRTKEKKIFHNSIPDEVNDFLKNTNAILIGHNFKYYDQYILKAILSAFSMDEIKNVNDHIIRGGQGFELSYEYVEMPPIWDTIQDIVPMKSLKEIEGNLCMDITESTVDFNIDHLLTEEEYKEMVTYCEADVDALFPFFELRLSYYKTKFDLCILSEIDPAYNIGLTNAKLVAKFLGAEKIERNDEREYTIPQDIDISLIDKKVLNFFNQIHNKNISSDVLFKSKLEYLLHGMPTVASWGGKHGALPNFIYEDDRNGNMVINCDFASLYPHLLALPKYNFISRNIPDKSKYKNTLTHRLELKAQGKKKEQEPLKLVLNTAYGCQNNKYNDLYDPKGARGTCITGQLLITELTEKIYNIGEVQLVQLNTDGLMIKIPKSKLDEYYKVCSDFSKRCEINLEYDIIYKIIQRDVNNYIMIYGDEKKKKIKAKGGCFASLPNIEVLENGSLNIEYKPNFKANSLAIVSEALALNLLFDTPVEETINNCDNIFKFQTISHLGSTYEKCILRTPEKDIELQRNNRIYAGKKPSGIILKIKENGREDSLANQPINPIIDNGNECTIEDIDKSWYIKLAKQWVNDFKGVKRMTEYKKEELLELAKERGLEVDKKIKKEDLIKLLEKCDETPVKEVEKCDEGEKKMNIYQKLNEIKKEIRKHDFVLDQVMPGNLGNKEYASIGQYYTVLHDTCEKYNVLFQWEVVNMPYDIKENLFKPTTGKPSHVATVECKATFIDCDYFGKDVVNIECNHYISYYSMASGSDICDKSVSGASTLAFRNFFDKNFTPKYMNGVEEINTNEEEQTEQPKIPTYIPETKKEEIKKEVVQTVQKTEEDKDDVKEIIDNIMKVRELSGKEDWGQQTLEALMNDSLSSADILEIQLKVENKLESLGDK